MRRNGIRQLRRRDLLRATSGAFVGGAIGSSVAGFATAESGDQRFIVVGNPAAKRRIERAGYEIIRPLADDDVLIVHGNGGDRDELLDVPGVRHVMPNVGVSFPDVGFDPGMVPEASGSGIQSEASEPVLWDRQWDKRVMDVPEAHETATGQGVRVAIIDTGIESGHPDLDPNLNEDLSVRFRDGQRIREGDPHDARPGGHGTQVAGIVAAAGIGVRGVAPDAELVSINIFQDDLPVGLWSVIDLLTAMEYAREIEADVVNMSVLSVGAPEDSATSIAGYRGGLRAAIERLTNMLARDGILMTASAGNFGANLQTGGQWWFPGGHNGVLNVSATGPKDRLVYYSNYGSRWIDVAAPGGGYETPEKTWCTDDGLIAGCQGSGDDPPVDPVDDCACDPAALPAPLNQVWSTGFDGAQPAAVPFSGTSAAAPQVAGIAALAREANPGLNARQLEQVIKHGAELVSGRGNDEFGAGRVNAANVVAGTNGPH